MTPSGLKKVLETSGPRYIRASRKKKGRILDGAEKVTDLAKPWSIPWSQPAPVTDLLRKALVHSLKSQPAPVGQGRVGLPRPTAQKLPRP